MRELLVGEAGAGIRHLDHRSVATVQHPHGRRGAGRRMRAHVREEVVEDLAQPLAVALHLDGDRRVELDLPARVERPRRLDCVARHVLELDRLALERPALVEPGEQEEVVDEQPHPPGFALDAVHRPLEIFRALAGAAVEELSVRPHGGKRRAQLVRRVGDEAAQPVLGCGALVECLLDLAEHGVERSAEPAHLGARIVVLDALREIAAGDRGCRVLDPAEWRAGQRARARGRGGGRAASTDAATASSTISKRWSVSSASFSGAATMSSWFDAPIGSSCTRKRVSPSTASTVKGAARGRSCRRAIRRGRSGWDSVVSPGRFRSAPHWTVPFATAPT